jgi:hypothetical protein
VVAEEEVVVVVLLLLQRNRSNRAGVDGVPVLR